MRQKSLSVEAVCRVVKREEKKHKERAREPSGWCV